MPLLRINATANGLSLTPPQLRTLRRALRDLPENAPVVILLHGFGYEPDHPTRCPHRHIYAASNHEQAGRFLAWPQRLGIGSGSSEPLCIAIGWPASGAFWGAYARAARTGRALAPLIRLIARLRPDKPVDFMAHSLGARVALAALPHCLEGSIGQMVLMAPAELHSVAATCLQSPAGRAAHVLAVTSRENLVFDRLVEWLLAPHKYRARAMTAAPAKGWSVLEIDRAEVQQHLSDLGIRIDPTRRRICHWSVYTRAGLFTLYSKLLCKELSFDALRTALPVAAIPPRLVPRIVARKPLVLALPFKSTGSPIG